jgi:hypothetical protein
MKAISKPTQGLLLMIVVLAAMALTVPPQKYSKPKPRIASQKIQAAILLDVSNSMDGLIEQAKAQLWNMVSTMGKAKCANNAPPQIEIALYEYGRSTNNIKEGYVKKINGFISNLDSLSINLFKLTTNGGDEFCGHVIYSSLDELKWDPSPTNYKVIFIAGNEDFLQGDIHYTKACAMAKNKGVVVNTIYCGDRMQGIREHWNLNAECGTGSYTNINTDAKVEDIPTPYDSLLFVYNDKLNSTYISYGERGGYYAANQAKADMLNTSMGKTAGLKRIKTKSNAQAYNNAEWDLVDAKDKDGWLAIEKVDKKLLPDSLKNKTTDELKKIVEEKSKERALMQKEIASLNTQRDAYIAAEKTKNATKNATNTLESEVERIIKEQAKKYNMIIQ